MNQALAAIAQPTFRMDVDDLMAVYRKLESMGALELSAFKTLVYELLDQINSNVRMRSLQQSSGDRLVEETECLADSGNGAPLGRGAA